MPLKLLTCIGFLCKVEYKIGRLRKFNRARKIELYFLTALTIFFEFSSLVQHAQDYNIWPQIFFWPRLTYGISKSKNRGKIITKLSKSVTKYWGKK